MSLERELTDGCPHCGETIFYRAASTEIHLGEKVKWRCTGEDCDHAFVQVGSDIDTVSG